MAMDPVFKIKKAYSSLGSAGDSGYALDLPSLRCTEECTNGCESWGALIEYPAFKFDFLTQEEYGPDLDRAISLKEFTDLASKIEIAAGRPVRVIPGAAIGELSGKVFTRKPDDFLWTGIIIPQIGKNTRDKLAGEGIPLLTADCSLRYRSGRKLDSHLAMQVEPVPLLNDESLDRLRIYLCPVCGHYLANEMFIKKLPRFYQIKRASWPKGRHLVQMLETLDVLASEEFMCAVEKHELTGIRFEGCGEFV